MVYGEVRADAWGALGYIDTQIEKKKVKRLWISYKYKKIGDRIYFTQ